MSAAPDTPEGGSELDKVRRHVRILVDLGKIAVESPSLDHFLDQAVLQVARAVEIDHVKVLRYRRATSDFIVAAGFGWGAGVVRSATLSADINSGPGRAYHTAEPVTVVDFAEQDEFVLSEFLKQHGIVALCNVPVLIDGAAWGVVEVDSAAPRDFSQDTTEFLAAVGTLIGVVVHRYTEAPPESEQMASAAREAQHREVLLREMQHRVKNNFQLLLASISLQRRRYSTGEAQAVLDNISSRITAIALAHDQLAVRTSGQIVKLSDYLRALCSSIRREVEGVEIEIDADDIELGVDRAVPIGLILNEAASNSIKHAFRDKGGTIAVRLATGVGYGEARLVIADNGAGMDQDRADRDGAGGSGLKLMESLARQIGGTIETESSEQGTTITLTFPVIV